MKKMYALIMCMTVCGAALFAQTPELDPALETEFEGYVKQIIAANEAVKIEPDGWGATRYSLPIKPEAQDLCDKVMNFIDDGGYVSTFQGWYMWVVSFDKETNCIILTDSGR